MTCQISHTAIDASDAYAQSVWWAGVLGKREDPDDPNLGETIAVYMIISMVFTVQPHILEKGATSVSALIALRYGASQQFAISALMAAGLSLFVLTLIVNFVASSIVARSRSGAESEV